MAELKEQKQSSSWKDIVNLKRAARLAAVEPYLELEIAPTDPITDLSDVDELAKLISDRKVSVEDVILAYIKRLTHLFHFPSIA